MTDSEAETSNRPLAWLVFSLALLVMLTGGVAGYLAWRGSRSSEHIAFVAGSLPQGLDLYLADARGDERVSLSQSQGDELFPAWSPDGHWLAYCRISLLGEGSGPRAAGAGVYLLDMSGDSAERRTRELLYPAQGGAAICPVWSPDGSRIALLPVPGFDEQDDQSTETTLVVIDLATRQQQEHVLPLRLTAQRLSWSPDGAQLALLAVEGDAEDATAPGDLFIYSLDSRALQRVAAGVTDVAWSPIEPLLACATLDEQPGLVLMNADGSGVRTLEDAYFVTSPAWSPAGDRLVYGRAGEMGYDVAVCDVATGDVTQAISGLAGYADYVSWSPGGRLVAFTVFSSTDNDVSAVIEVLDTRTLTKAPFKGVEVIEGMAVWQPSRP